MKNVRIAKAFCLSLALALLFSLSTVLLPSTRVVHASPPSFTVTTPIVVASSQDFTRVGIANADTSVPCVRTDSGTYRWFDYASPDFKSTVFESPLDAPFQTVVSQTANYYNVWDMNGIQGENWIYNIYKIPATGHYLGFVHLEHLNNLNWKQNGETYDQNNRMRIGLALSTDQGVHWKYLGHIIAPYNDSNVNYNITGVPYVIKDGYIYVYYNESLGNGAQCNQRTLNVVRAKLTDVVNAAENYQVTAWDKYYNGSWGQPGLGGMSTALLPPGTIDAHCDATYNTYINKFIMVGRSYTPTTATRILFSDDGVNWGEPQLLAPMTDLHYYYSIVGTGMDNRVTGQSFYVYWTQRLPNNGPYKQIMRTTVTFGGPAPAPTPSMLHRYRLENNVNDSAGTTNGITYGGASYSNSDFVEGNYAGNFDGTDDYINFDNISFPSAGQPYTITAWVKPAEISAQWKTVMHVGDKNANKFTEFRAEGGKFAGLFYNGTTNFQVNADANYSINTWYHLVMVYNGIDLKFYVNSAIQNGGNGLACTTDYGGNLRLDIARCYEQRNPALYWPGKVDDVKIYNHALTGTQVGDLYRGVPVDAKGYWKLDETGGAASAADSSGNDRRGTVYGSVIWNANGHKEGCLELDGSNDYVWVADHNDLDLGTGDFALSLWFKRDANAAANLRVLSKGGENNTDSGYSIWASNTTVTVGLSNGTTRLLTTGVNHSGVNAWTHLAVNFDRDGNMQVYVNGQLATETSISSMNGNIIDSTRNLDVGRTALSGLYWDGLIDEVSVFKRLLTTQEISSLYQE